MFCLGMLLVLGQLCGHSYSDCQLNDFFADVALSWGYPNNIDISNCDRNCKGLNYTRLPADSVCFCGRNAAIDNVYHDPLILQDAWMFSRNPFSFKAAVVTNDSSHPTSVFLVGYADHALPAAFAIIADFGLSSILSLPTVEIMDGPLYALFEAPKPSAHSDLPSNGVTVYAIPRSEDAVFEIYSQGYYVNPVVVSHSLELRCPQSVVLAPTMKFNCVFDASFDRGSSMNLGLSQAQFWEIKRSANEIKAWGTTPPQPLLVDPVVPLRAPHGNALLSLLFLEASDNSWTILWRNMETAGTISPVTLCQRLNVTQPVSRGAANWMFAMNGNEEFLLVEERNTVLARRSKATPDGATDVYMAYQFAEFKYRAVQFEVTVTDTSLFTHNDMLYVTHEIFGFDPGPFNMSAQVQITVPVPLTRLMPVLYDNQISLKFSDREKLMLDPAKYTPSVGLLIPWDHANYSWSCQLLGGGACPTFIVVPQTSHTLELSNRTGLQAGVIYVITLAITFTPECRCEASNASILVEIISDFSKPLAIRCRSVKLCPMSADGTFRIDPNSSFVLEANCPKAIADSCFNIRHLRWELYAVSANSTSEIPDKETYIEGLSDSAVKVKADLFNKYPNSIVFQLYFSGNEGGSSSTMVTFTSNKPPQGGHCDVSPKEGAAFDTQFTFKCIGWQDEDGVAYYRYAENSLGYEILIVSNRSTSQIQLPLFNDGLSASSLVVFVGDDLNAETYYPLGSVKLADINCTQEHLVSNIDTQSQSNNALYLQHVGICALSHNVTVNVSRLRECQEDLRLINVQQLGIVNSTEYCQNVQIHGLIQTAVDAVANLSPYPNPGELSAVAHGVDKILEALPQVTTAGRNGLIGVVEKLTNNFAASVDLYPSHQVEQMAKEMFQLAATLSEKVAVDIALPSLDIDLVSGARTYPTEYCTHLPYDPDDICYAENWSARETAENAARTYNNRTDDKLVQALDSMLSSIADAMIKINIPGNKSLDLHASRASMQLMYTKLAYLTEQSLDFPNQNVVVTIPAPCDVSNRLCDEKQQNKLAYQKVVVMEKNAYTFADKMQQITTPSVQIELFLQHLHPDEDGKYDQLSDTEKFDSIPVQKASVPVEITFAVNMSDASWECMDRAKRLEKYQLMRLHQINIRNAFSGLYIKLNKTGSRKLYLFLREGNVPGLLMHNFSSWTQDNNFEWFISNEQLGNKAALWYLGVAEAAALNSTSGVQQGGFRVSTAFSTDYCLSTSCPSCMYVNRSITYDPFGRELTRVEWQGTGCKAVGLVNGNLTCQCSHLTVFGAGLVIAPNTLNFDYILKNASFRQNVSIYVTLIVFFVAYVCLLIWCKKKDNEDEHKLGCIPLPDNLPADKYVYEILIETGLRREAATDSKVTIIFNGSLGTSGPRNIEEPPYKKLFRRGAADRFVMTTSKSLGDLDWIRLWHDNSGQEQFGSWYLNQVTVTDLQLHSRFVFICNQWLAAEKGDGKVDRVFPVTTSDDQQKFNTICSRSAHHRFTDDHMWFSLWGRPPMSRFTRCQRVTCCMCLLLMSIVVSGMWYGKSKTSPGKAFFEVGPLTISMGELVIGFMSTLIVFPVNMLLVTLFRRTKLREKRKSPIIEALAKSHNTALVNRLTDKKTDPKQPKTLQEAGEQPAIGKPRYKRRFLLPWWCRYVTWLLGIVIIVVSALIIASYGISFGEHTTRQWLSSIIIGFLSSIFFTEPLKIIILATILAWILKDSLRDNEQYERDLLEDEEEFRNHVAAQHNKDTAYDDYRTFSEEASKQQLEKDKERRELELRTWDALREILTFVVFIFILMVLVYGSRDQYNYFLQNNINNTFIIPNKSTAVTDDRDLNATINLADVTTPSQFWRWARTVLAPGLRAKTWYNGSAAIYERGFIADYTSRLIGHAVMRQIRAKYIACPPIVYLRNAVWHQGRPCTSYSSIINEDRNSYGVNWTAEPTDLRPEYKYTDASALHGQWMSGKVDYYSGGGYTLFLIGTADELRRRFVTLANENWIDGRTRAIIIEFYIYCVNENLFSINTIMLESPPTGGWIISHRFDPVRLLHFEQGFGLFVMICEGVFCIFLLVFIVKECKNFKRQSWSYFRLFWNWVELAIIVFCTAAIITYLIRYVITQNAVQLFTVTHGNAYINLRTCGTMEEIFTYLIGFVIFFTSIKFIRLLRFNVRLTLMTRTLKACCNDLLGMGLVFGLLMLAFSHAFYHMMSRELESFSTLVKTVETVMQHLLNKIPFEAVQHTRPVLGPIFSVLLFFMGALVMLNLFVTIVVTTQKTVREEGTKEVNDLEVIQYVQTQLCRYVGIDAASQAPLDIADSRFNDAETLKKLHERVNRMWQLVCRLESGCTAPPAVRQRKIYATH